MPDRITLTKGDHTVTTTVPTEAVTLEAHGYTRQDPRTAAKTADTKTAAKKS